MNNSNDEVQLRVALYLRVSTDEQAEKYGLSAQRSAIEGIIKSRGKLKDGRDAMILTSKVYEYIDDGVSGTTEIDERFAFRQLKEDILNAPDGQKPFDVVAVYKIDRFARKLRILMDVLKFFEEKKIEFVSATESIDTSTPFGRAMLGIMGVIAELELETIRERTQRGREQAIQEGVFMGTHAPFGYKKDKEGKLVIFDTEAKIVKKIFDLFVIDKYSTQKIADILTQDEMLSPDASAIKYGKKRGTSRKTNTPYFWRQERIRMILSDNVYTGVLYYNKTKKGKVLPKDKWSESPHRHKSIIPAHYFDLALFRLKQLSDRKTLTQKKVQGNIYLLSGLLKCDHCKGLGDHTDDRLTSWTGDRKLLDKESRHYSYYYRCTRKNEKKFSVVCPVVPIPAEPLEKYVINFVTQLLSNPKATFEYQKELKSSTLNSQHIQKIEDDKNHFVELLNGLPSTRQRLIELHEIGVIDKQALQNKLSGLNDKKTDYKKKIEGFDLQLSQFTLSKGYEASLSLYSEKYSKALNDIINDKEELYDLIHRLIYQIVVHSRPKSEKDIIAGRRKNGQMIPERIDICLNLPQNLLQELYTQRFGVKNHNLWTLRDSNP